VPGAVHAVMGPAREKVAVGADGSGDGHAASGNGHAGNGNGVRRE
jgi:hypothetical protein